ncbi:MAG: TIGR04100 family radical SAM protein [Oscillospiraceae bacterium]|nr:TIGR04100 family radical SAM protein [Oscillospiraceae bacterium]
MTILYPVGKALYINLTNQCPCNCTFCIRNNGEGAYGSDSLWLEHDPDFEEVKAAFAAYDLSQWTELVFCGYGEPTMRLELLIETAAYVRSLPDCPPIRLNTNGLSDLIHDRSTAQDLAGLIDVVSISLNAGTEAEYMAVTRPKWENAFAAMQRFAVECKQFVPKVMFTVVDVISKEEIAAAQQMADAAGIPLRVREYTP